MWKTLVLPLHHVGKCLRTWGRRKSFVTRNSAFVLRKSDTYWCFECAAKYYGEAAFSTMFTHTQWEQSELTVRYSRSSSFYFSRWDRTVSASGAQWSPPELKVCEREQLSIFQRRSLSNEHLEECFVVVVNTYPRIRCRFQARSPFSFFGIHLYEKRRKKKWDQKKK